ncbi:MAG: phosphogluconate dehydratase [Halioglobus sp.]|nr:phosphogluconate dehydratase [Halioglobus sp.]
MHPVVEEVTANLRRRSHVTRQAYLERCRRSRDETPPKRTLSCGNLAHGYAACNEHEKQLIGSMSAPNIGIINAYNDMLSAHQPLADYPALVKSLALELGATAQVASGVPAMCDGVTQGQPGMELSLFSRDVVAMATAIGLSHNLFDAALCLGICDKIVPGMLIGALQFGHLPTGFIGSGPMATGIPNKEKAAVRQQFAAGTADEAALLAVESASYHSAGTCTFYGTANTNQVMMEVLGLQLPGSSFLHPDDPLRPALTQRTIAQLVRPLDAGGAPRLCDVVTEASLVNAVVAILATGGSTNHTLHLVAIAQAAGIDLTWEDMDELSRSVPLLARVYPNGSADINDFQAGGGTAFIVRELCSGRLLNEDVVTLLGEGLAPYTCTPTLDSEGIAQWVEEVKTSRRLDVLRPVGDPFADEGGLRSLAGNLGHCIIKTSAVEESHQVVKAPCRVFDSQQGLKAAFDAGELDRDVIAVVRFQGPAANGMPELHKMTPYLGELQDRGHKVALVTDGRMSGASGKVPAAIHLSPEAVEGGPIGRLQDGDVIELDAHRGQLNVLLPMAELEARPLAQQAPQDVTLGRNLFDVFRRNASRSTSGGSVFGASRHAAAD